MRQRLADDALDGADDERDGVGALAERLQAPGDAVGVTARLVEMRLEHGAVGRRAGVIAICDCRTRMSDCSLACASLRYCTTFC